jgi:hypothetical protein
MKKPKTIITYDRASKEVVKNKELKVGSCIDNETFIMRSFLNNKKVRFCYE